MIYRLQHVTRYRYAETVTLAQELLHLTPRAATHQRILASQLTLDPAPDRRVEATDHFGNGITRLLIATPHRFMHIGVKATVAVDPQPVPATTPGWRDVRAALEGGGFPQDAATAEFLWPSPLLPAGGELEDLAGPAFPPGCPVLDGALALMHAIWRGFAYDPTATDVTTPLATVLRLRRGVCQDFAHVMIAALRSRGLAARYVSGYIHTGTDGQDGGLRGADASHAWVSVWCGAEAGWVDLDPTNDKIVTDEHLTLAWGRDYGDVTPVRGVVTGGGAHSLSVAVTMTRTDAHG